ncbi:regulatory protein, arsR family [Micrococcales bacterium KH10]|nr:regulatory protein, arsR family [Micrococcales bacterium KH10]
MDENGVHHLPDVLSALNHPLRLNVIAALSQERKYVSELARELGISRPLLYMHLERLEKAGLVQGSLELSAEGKAIKWYSLKPFDIRINLETVLAALAQTQPPTSQGNAEMKGNPNE